uniref:Chromosome 8 open reading frame 34 n=1 Tax=Accipiter nisus TaxID=211598 RepID=A0A8B9N214_9AVES
MASHQQTRIQAYLEKNKIGPLFEELMTKLITETPDQPIPFLIDHLQSKQGNRSQLQRTLSGSAALWAESETSENKGTRRDFRSYDKPWQVNAKKPKKSKSDLAVSSISPPSPESKSLPRSIEHPKWDWRTKPENHDFDELNHILQESKKLGKALENLSRSIAISDELDKDTTGFNTPLLRPRVIGEWIGREENDADPLAAEMLQPPIPRNKNEQWDSEDSSSPGGSLKMEPKTKGLKQQQQQHKKLLAAMLSQDSFDSAQSTAPSVTEEDIDNEDDAMELLGNCKKLCVVMDFNSPPTHKFLLYRTLCYESMGNMQSQDSSAFLYLQILLQITCFVLDCNLKIRKTHGALLCFCYVSVASLLQSS